MICRSFVAYFFVTGRKYNRVLLQAMNVTLTTPLRRVFPAHYQLSYDKITLSETW